MDILPPPPHFYWISVGLSNRTRQNIHCSSPLRVFGLVNSFYANSDFNSTIFELYEAPELKKDGDGLWSYSLALASYLKAWSD